MLIAISLKIVFEHILFNMNNSVCLYQKLPTGKNLFGPFVIMHASVICVVFL